MNQELIQAAIVGDRNRVEQLLRIGADIHAVNDRALCLAASRGDEAVVRLLLDPKKHGINSDGADIHARNDWAVRGATFHGHLDVVCLPHNKGEDIHAADGYGPDGAVRWEARNGHLDVVSFLYENGANIHAVNDEAVRGAANNGHLDVVSFLAFRPGLVRNARALPGVLINPRGCKKGADIHADNDEALRGEAMFGRLNVVRFLHPLRLVRTPDEVRAQRTNLGQSKKGADIHADDDYSVRYAAEGGYLDVVRFLHPLRLVRTPDEVRAQRTNLGQSEKGADIHTSDNHGPDSAVRVAALNGHLSVVHFLAENGADIRANNDLAVYWAALHSRLDVIVPMADIRAADHNGPDKTVCKAAQTSGSGHLDVVRFLVNPRKYGLDIEGCDRNVLAQNHPEVLARIQQLEQQELYQNARVMYYASVFAKQSDYTTGGCGSLIQALDISL